MSLYWEDALGILDESQLQDLLTEVFQNNGFQVKNMHRTDPKSENGADLEVRKGEETILIAVKEKPRKSDIEQMQRLWKRRSEASLVYAYIRPSTGDFAREEKKLSGDIKFLQGKGLHDFLLEGESLTYLRIIFEHHQIVKEYSDALSIFWSHRHVKIPEKFDRDDLLKLYSLKEAILKKRVGVGVFALKFDNYVNSLHIKNPKEFPKILDDSIENLNVVQIYAGISLLDMFRTIAETAPYLFSLLWRNVSQRTYWKQYTISTEKLPDTHSVSEFTAKYWVLPGDKAIGEAQLLSGNAIGFLSCLSKILESLASSLRVLDNAIDNLWMDSYCKV